MSALCVELPNRRATEQLARRIAPHLMAGDLVILDGPLGSGVFDDIGFIEDSYYTTSGSVGLKLNVAPGMLVNFNLRFNATAAGLTDRLVPLLGVEYGF